MRTLLLLNGLALVTANLYLIGTLLAGRIWKLRDAKVSFLPGPRLLTIHIGTVAFSLGAIPIPGAGVEWTAGDSAFDRLPRLARACILLAGPLFTFLLAMALLGPARASLSVQHGFHQLFLLLFYPFSDGQVLLNGVSRIVEEQHLIVLLGVVAAKTTALILVPIPPIAGGQALFGMFYKGAPKPNWLHALQSAVAVLALLGMASFLAAEVTFLVR
jgi:membrane-associated protease RseP (regulator of RpoE activity)